MHPQILVTNELGDTDTSKKNNGDSLKIPRLLAPTWDMTRRPSCLPNDTDINIRPKLNKINYDLSTIDSLTTASFDPSSNSGLTDSIETDVPNCMGAVTNWVFGDVQYITDFLDRWPAISFVIPFRIINAILRTLGAPLLLNNPFSGILILAVLMIEAPLVACWGLAGVVLAFIMALVLKQSQHILTSGQVTQHGLLLGLFIGRALLHNPECSLSTAAFSLALSAPLRYVCSRIDYNIFAYSITVLLFDN